MLEVRGTSRTRRDERDRVEGVNGGQERQRGEEGAGKEGGETVVDAVYTATGETHFVHRSGI